MAIGFRAAGTAVTSATTTLASIGVPAGLASTDISFLFVTVKGFAVNVNTPSGWIRTVELVNGAVASGLDTGSVRTVVFKKTGTYSAPTVTLATSPTVAQAVIVAYTRGASESWVVQATATGFDATAGANYSATATAQVNTTSGDWLLAFTGLDSDAGTPSALSLTETSVTFAGTQSRFNTGTTTGDDGRMVIADNSATSGTGSAAPVFAFTNASTSSGGTCFIRLKVATTAFTVSPINPIDDTAAYELTATNLTAYTSWEMFRNSTHYGTEFVRGGSLQETTGSTAVVGDYEFHFSDEDSTSEESLTWTLNLYHNGILQESLVTAARNPVLDRSVATGFGITSVVSFVKDCFTPVVNVRAIVQDFTGFSKEGKVLAKHSVLGRSNPIVISDVSSGMTGSIKLLVVGTVGFTASDGATLNKQIDDLFKSGSTYMFQSIFPFVTGIPDFFFQVENYSYERINRRPFQAVARASDLTNPHPIGIWEINFIQVDRPAALDVAVSANIWGSSQILNIWGTWENVRANNTDWLDVLQQGD